MQDGLNVLQGLYLKEKKEAKQEYDKAKIYSEKHAVDMQEQIQKGIVVNSKNAGNDIYNGTSNSQNYYAFKAKDLEASIDYLTNSTNELNERTKVLNKEIESCNTEGEIEEKIDDIAAVNVTRTNNRNAKTKAIIEKKHADKMQEICKKEEELKTKETQASTPAEKASIKAERDKLQEKKQNELKEKDKEIAEENHKDKVQEEMREATGMNQEKLQSIIKYLENKSSPKAEKFKNIMYKKEQETKSNPEKLEQIDSIKNKVSYFRNLNNDKFGELLDSVEQLQKLNIDTNNIVKELNETRQNLEDKVESLNKALAENRYKDAIEKYGDLSNEIRESYFEIESKVKRNIAINADKPKPARPKPK